MARGTPHLLKRNDRYYARVVVPKPLRAILQKTELLRPLGPDLKTAKRQLPRSVAEMLDQLSSARSKLGQPVKVTARPLKPDEIAKLYYDEELNLDAVSRDFRHREELRDLDFSLGEKRRDILKRVASGLTEDDEMAANVGWEPWRW